MNKEDFSEICHIYCGLKEERKIAGRVEQDASALYKLHGEL